MGTRCLTVLKDTEGQEIVVLYRQFDGYIEGHGKELAKFCKDMKIVNGMSGDDQKPFANGMSCLAAQIIAHFKKEAGGFYLHPAGTRDCGEDYTYTVSQKPEGQIGHNEKRTIQIEVKDYDEKIIFAGTASELVDFQEPDEE